MISKVEPHKNQISEYYLVDKKSPREIAEIFENLFKEDSIRRKLKKWGIYKEVILNKRISNFEEKLKILHSLNFSAGKISILLSMDMCSVTYNMRKLGLEVGASGKSKFDRNNIPRIIELYKSGLNQREISKELNVGRNTIKYYLDKFGINILSRSEILRRDSYKRLGENNPNYKHGLSKEVALIRGSKEISDWRNQIFIRDNYKCISCDNKKKIKNLEAHHLLLFSKHLDERFNLDNGITLCDFCHDNLHKMIGYKDTNKDDVLNLLQIEVQ